MSTDADRWLPSYQFVECHRTRVRASPAATFEALKALDLGQHASVRVLLALRGLSHWFNHRPATSRPMGWPDAERIGFVALEERAGAFLAHGLIGQFWRARGNLRRGLSAHDYLAWDREDDCKLLWTFTLSSDGACTTLSTETRVHCPSLRARRRFWPYWLLIRPFSGWIRRVALAQVRRRAEHAGVRANNFGTLR